MLTDCNRWRMQFLKQIAITFQTGSMTTGILLKVESNTTLTVHISFSLRHSYSIHVVLPFLHAVLPVEYLCQTL